MGLINQPGRRDSSVENTPYRPPHEPDGSSDSLPSPLDYTQSRLPEPLMKLVHPISPEELTPVQANTQSYARRFFNYIASNVVTGALKTVENCIFTPSAIRTAYNENIKELQEMTGSQNLGDFLTETSDLLADSLAKNFGGDGLIKQGLEHESAFLHLLTESMMTKLAVNVGRQLQAEGQQVSPFGIVAYLATVMKKETDAAQEALTEANKIKDPKGHTEAVKKASLPAIDAFLSLAFPKGAKELPLRSKIQGYAWSYLRNTILPKYLLEFNKASLGIQGLTRLPHIEKNPQMEFLSKVSTEAGALFENEVPLLLKDDKIAEAIAKKILFYVSPHVKNNPLLPWLTAHIRDLGKSGNLQASDFWTFLGGKTGVVVSYVLFNLAKSTPDEEAGTAIFLNTLDKISQFYGQHHDNVIKVYQELVEKGVKPETSPEYIECFIPLTKMLEDISGVGVLKSFLPNRAITMLNDARDQNISKMIAEIYQSHLAAAVEIYRATQDPSLTRQTEDVKQLAHGEKVGAQIEEASQLVSKQASAYFSENHSVLANDVCDMLFEAAPSIRLKLRETVLGEPEILKQTALPMPTESPFKSWLRGWLENQMKNLETAKDPRVRQLWSSLGNIAGGVLEKSVLSMSKESPDISNMYEAIVDKVGTNLSEFIDKNGPEIQEHFLRLHDEGFLAEDDPEFIARFAPLCQDLIVQLGFDGEDASIAEKFLIQIIKKQIPKVLASKFNQYLVPADALKQAREKLEGLFAAENEAESSVIAEQIDNLCGVLAQQIAPAVKVAAYDEIKAWTGNLPEGVRTLSQLDRQNRYLQNTMKSLLLQLVVNYLQVAQVKEIDGIQVKTPLSEINVSQILEKFANTLEHHLAVDGPHIQKAATTADPETRQLALREAFTPLTQGLIRLISPSPSKSGPQGIPIEVPFQNELGSTWEKLQTQIIPDTLANMFMDTTTWAREVEASRQAIVSETKSHLLPESCRVIGEWVGDFIPALLCQDKAELSQGVYDGVANFLASTGNPEGISVADFIKKNEIFIKKSLYEDLFSFFAPDSPLATSTKPVTSKYVEAVLLKLCKNLTTKINDVQGREIEKQQEFMVDLGINLLRVANEHFANLNDVTKANQEYAAHAVPHERFVQGFKESLHPGIPRKTANHQLIKELSKVLEKERRLYSKLSGTKKEECSARIKEAKLKLKEAKATQSKERQAFFKPLTAKLLSLSGVTKPEDLPVPAALQAELWQRFNDDLFPMILENIFEEITRPETRVKMVISGLKNLNEALDTITPDSETELDTDDDAQKKLNQVCGELVLQLVQLVPQSLVQAAFKIDKFKLLEKQSAEIVGKAVRKYLGDDQNILKIIDKGLLVGMPEMRPGAWKEGADGFRFVNSDTEDLTFPLNEEEYEAIARKKLAIADLELQEMRKLMVDTTHRVMSDAVTAFFTGPYLKLKVVCNFCIDKIFGKYGDSIKEFFSLLTEKTIFKLIEAGLAILSYPFRAAFWFFMDIHIGRKADHVIKSLQLDIHENLLYKLTDTFIEAVEGKGDVPDAVIQPIVAAAEQRQVTERLVVMRYLKKLGLDLADIRTRAQTKAESVVRPKPETKKKADSQIQEPAS